MRYSFFVVLGMALLWPQVSSAQVFSFGFGFRGGYPGYRGYYGGYYGYPAYGTYYYPGSVYPPPLTYVPAQVVPAESSAGHARVTVLLPDAHAELLIQGQRMNSVGTVRTFSSQALQAGNEYTYAITMRSMNSGQPVEDARQVHVHAGSIITVDFTKPHVESFPAAPTVPAVPRRAVPNNPPPPPA